MPNIALRTVAVVLGVAVSILGGSALAQNVNNPKPEDPFLDLPDRPENRTGAEVRVLVSAGNSAVLSTQIDGVVKEIARGEGARFKKDDILITFDCREYEVIKSRSYAALQQRIENRRNREQLARLKSAGTLEVAQAKAEEAMAQADYDLASIPVDRCDVTAPYNGKVIQVLVQKHQFVSRGKPLIEILDDSSFEIKLIIPSLWLSWLKVGEKLSVRLDETGETHAAKVARIGSKIDPVSQTIAVTAKFTRDPDFIIPGMSGSATFDR